MQRVSGSERDLLGFAFWLSMTDWPPDARWLAAEQRDWLITRLQAEHERREAVGT